MIVAFSLNPPDLIAAHEHGTASLQARLRAAARLIDWGYRVAFHFDPIIPCTGWKEKYLAVLEALKTTVPAERIAWISLGTFRFPKGLDDAVPGLLRGEAAHRALQVVIVQIHNLKGFGCYFDRLIYKPENELENGFEARDGPDDIRPFAHSLSSYLCGDWDHHQTDF